MDQFYSFDSSIPAAGKRCRLVGAGFGFKNRELRRSFHPDKIHTCQGADLRWRKNQLIGDCGKLMGGNNSMLHDPKPMVLQGDPYQHGTTP
jgi:hypothetical protein